LRSDDAAIQTAKLNLEYCTIFSPLDGRTGAVMVKAGNLIKASDVPIVVINQVNPIFVNFTVPQQYLEDIKKRMAGGALHVAATIPDSSGPSEVGTLTFVDNAVDVTTGTIHMRGTFANTQNRLWPGLFVNTVLTLSDEANATVVPAQAIVSQQSGSVVYVVKSDNTVELRPVASGRTVEGETVVTKGLERGETVVVDGNVNLTSGAKIEIKNGQNDADASVPPAPRVSQQDQTKP
jgi:membrane fusion protein, multidrug efflux system